MSGADGPGGPVSRWRDKCDTFPGERLLGCVDVIHKENQGNAISSLSTSLERRANGFGHCTAIKNGKCCSACIELAVATGFVTETCRQSNRVLIKSERFFKI